MLVPVQIEERSSIQQATGSARPIHSWPGQNSQDIAAQFDQVLDYALESLNKKHTRRPTRAERKAQRMNNIMRGQSLDDVLQLEKEAEPETDKESES